MKQSITVMVVDDELMMRKLVEKVLTRDGFQVVSAGDGEEAMRVLSEKRVDIIISDINMPRLNGFELLRSVKQKFPNIAVILMTAYGDTYSVKDALLLGADEYVTKPFQAHEIALIVERTYWRVLSAQRQSEATK